MLSAHGDLPEGGVLGAGLLIIRACHLLHVSGLDGCLHRRLGVGEEDPSHHQARVRRGSVPAPLPLVQLFSFYKQRPGILQLGLFFRV